MKNKMNISYPRPLYGFLADGDVISLENSRGFLATSSPSSEPGFVSISRPCPLQLAPDIDDDDFHQRCLYQIKAMDTDSEDSAVIIKFGMVVQLYSHPSGYVLCGEKDANGKFNICARDMEVVPPSFLESQWIVSSKYKLRQSGENVRDRDYLIFRCVQNPEQKLVFGYDSTSEKGIQTVKNTDIGWKIDILRKNEIAKSRNLCFGDYIKLSHIERGSELISRIEFKDSFHPAYGRLGMLARECTEESRARALFRPVRADEDRTTAEGCGTSGINIWQVLPVTNSSKLTAVMDSSKVCLRHALSGLFLSLVPSSEESSPLPPESMKRLSMRMVSTRGNDTTSPRYISSILYAYITDSNFALCFS